MAETKERRACGHFQSEFQESEAGFWTGTGIDRHKDVSINIKTGSPYFGNFIEDVQLLDAF